MPATVHLTICEGHVTRNSQKKNDWKIDHLVQAEEAFPTLHFKVLFKCLYYANTKIGKCFFNILDDSFIINTISNILLINLHQKASINIHYILSSWCRGGMK